jgi:hypothetical protein
MSTPRKDFEKALFSTSDFSPLSSVSKSEISSRCGGVLHHVSIIDAGNVFNGLKKVMKTTNVQKRVLNDITNSVETFFVTNFLY